MDLTVLKDLYKKVAGCEPESITEMPSSGSNRRYFRLSGTRTLIGVVGTCREENEAFIYMDRHFRNKGIPVPEVYAFSDDRMSYVQEDLGDELLFNAIEKGRKTSVFSDEEKQLLAKTIRLLPDIQFAGADGMDFGYCYPAAEFDSRSIMWDLNYFKYCFLKATGLEFLEDKLEDDFQKMTDVLLRSSSATFMYPDFQSRNVMIRDGQPWFIDFQGGRKGPFYYDVASFLWQAKANLPDSLRRELVKEYISALRKYQPVDEAYFYAQLRHFVLFRTLQVLGAYGFRGYFEKKPHFIQSVPFAIENLRNLLKEPYPEYPYLSKVLTELVNMKQFSDDLQKRMLTVKVMSLEKKKGIALSGATLLKECSDKTIQLYIYELLNNKIALKNEVALLGARLLSQCNGKSLDTIESYVAKNSNSTEVGITDAKSENTEKNSELIYAQAIYYFLTNILA